MHVQYLPLLLAQSHLRPTGASSNQSFSRTSSVFLLLRITSPQCCSCFCRSFNGTQSTPQLVGSTVCGVERLCKENLPIFGCLCICGSLLLLLCQYGLKSAKGRRLLSPPPKPWANPAKVSTVEGVRVSNAPSTTQRARKWLKEFRKRHRDIFMRLAVS